MRWHVLRSPVASNTRSLDFGVAKPGVGVNILAYVHLRNIYRSTGAGRVAREMTDYLSRRPDVHMQILADPGDHARVIDKVGAPWTGFQYHFFKHETSKQQALWYLSDRPAAEDFWPGTDIVFCTAESYVPVRRAKLVVTCHDAQLFEPDAHQMSRWLVQQRFKWRLLFGKLADEASVFHTISNFAASRMAHYFPRIESRLRVVPNAVSESFFHPATEIGRTVLARLGIAGRPYILVPGGLHHRKNADLILDVWPKIHALRPGRDAGRYGSQSGRLPGSRQIARTLPGPHRLSRRGAHHCALPGCGDRLVPLPLRGLRSPGARGHGLRNAHRDQQHHRDS